MGNIEKKVKEKKMNKTTDTFAGFECPEWEVIEEENDVDKTIEQWFTNAQTAKHERRQKRKSLKKRRTLHKESVEPIERQRNMCELQKPAPKQDLPVPKPKLCVIDQPRMTMSRLNQLAQPKHRRSNVHKSGQKWIKHDYAKT